jgi:flavorubredoxin
MMYEAKKYYANIVMPYGNQVKKALDNASKLDIETIAPSHGLIWKDHISDIISAYTKWSANETDDRAVVMYDTMWGSTQKIAETLQRTFESLGVPSGLYCLQDTHISDIVTELQESRYICVGSPTLNSNMLPTVGAFLTYLKGLSPKKRLGLAFGSYGWGGQSIPQIHEILEKLGFEMMMDDLKCKYIPSQDVLAQAATELIETMNRIRQE